MVQSVPSKQSLTSTRRLLVEWMQDLNFGRIEHLQIRSGQPVLDPPPRLIREVKFGGHNDPRPEQFSDDFLLKSQVVELFSCFEELNDGVIDVLEVKHGLPFRSIIEDTRQ